MRSMRVPCRRESAYPVVRTYVRIHGYVACPEHQSAGICILRLNPAMDSPRSSLNLLLTPLLRSIILLNPRVAQAENAGPQIFTETGAALASGC